MGLTHLRKFSTTYYKDKVASTDLAQIPAASATVSVYKQGSSATSGTTVTTAVGGVAVTVRSPGGLVLADTVQLGTDATKQMIVEEITSETSIKLRSTTGSSIVVAASDRFVPYSNIPTLYSESTGVGTTANPTSANSSGFVKFFITERVFDVIVSGSGLTTTLYIDEESGRLVPRRSHYNVKDFIDTTSALAAIPNGSSLYFPAEDGPYTPPTAAGWTISKPVHIYSDGTSIGENKGFQYFNSAAAANKDSVVFKLLNTAGRFRLTDTVISNNVGAVSADGVGDAIQYLPAGAGTPLNYVEIERVHILYAGRCGLNLGDGTQSILHVRLQDSLVKGVRGPGVFVRLCNVLRADRVHVAECRGGSSPVTPNGSAFMLYGVGNFSLDACTGESCGQALSVAAYDAYIHCALGSGGSIRDCHIEDLGEAAIKNGIVLNQCRAAVVGANTISFSTAAAGSRGIHLINSCKSCIVMPNEHVRVEHAVQIDSAANDIGNVVMPQMVQIGNATAPGKTTIPVGSRNFALVNDLTASVADNKGVGMLLPSHPDHTTIDASVVQDGLLVYNSTTDKLMIRANGAWVVVGTQT